MLCQGKYSEHDSIYVKEKIDVVRAYTLSPGHFLKKGEDEVGEYYYPGDDEPGHSDKAILAYPRLKAFPRIFFRRSMKPTKARPARKSA